jgi:nucleoside-diphosphate-sugar epimerase
MKICISGHKGFVGGHLINYLNTQLDVELVYLQEVNQHLSSLENLLKHVGEFDVFIHLASTSYVPDSYEKPHFFYYNNFNTTLNALELCRVRKARFIFISSYVYGNTQYLPIDELHPINSPNVYTHTKIVNEQLCKQYSDTFDLRTTIIRPFNLYGPGQNDKFLIPSIIKQAQGGRVVLNDPRPMRDFLYIDDFVEAIFLAAANDTISKNDVINIASGKSYSIQEIIDIVAKHYPNIEVVYTNIIRPNEIMNTVGDIQKAKQILNWSPQVSLNEGIAKIINTINDRLN